MYYLGHTFYNISYHNPLKCIDLPVFTSIEKASRHDALTIISATAQMLDINPSLHPSICALILPVTLYLFTNIFVTIILHHLLITILEEIHQNKENCSSSSYGRVVYINDGDDARNGGPIVYKSDKWKQIYKNRTSTERINNRVLNDYHLHQMFIRDEAKHAFFSIFSCINIHLDAWVQDEI